MVKLGFYFRIRSTQISVEKLEKWEYRYSVRIEIITRNIRISPLIFIRYME